MMRIPHSDQKPLKRPSQSSSGRSQVPRIVIYHQTHHPNGQYLSLQPMIQSAEFRPTHLILAALHLNDPPGNIHLNDHPPSHPRFDALWSDVHALQSVGVPVLLMIGGAAVGTFARLDGDDAHFEAYYGPLRELIAKHDLDGLDLDVEEPMSLTGIIRLILRLRADFGPDFLITLAPVAPALSECPPANPDFAAGRRRPDDHSLDCIINVGTDQDPVMILKPRPGNLSHFSYGDLERAVGGHIAWYNTQFYCGWGSLAAPANYQAVMAQHAVPAHKIVAGTVTNPGNCRGWASARLLRTTLQALIRPFADDTVGSSKLQTRTLSSTDRPDTEQSPANGFAGVMGWELFNAVVGRGGHWQAGEAWGAPSAEPWRWIAYMRQVLIEGVGPAVPEEIYWPWDGRWDRPWQGQDECGRWR